MKAPLCLICMLVALAGCQTTENYPSTGRQAAQRAALMNVNVTDDTEAGSVCVGAWCACPSE